MVLRRLLKSSLSSKAKTRRKYGAFRSNRSCRIENLECRRLLAIDWVNQGANNFGTIYAAEDAVIATAIVERAVSDWEAVITDFNYDGDNNPNTANFLNDTYNLTINAGTFAGGLRATTNIPTLVNGLPTATTVTMDNDGGGAGWFFDTSPVDDIEFTSIADSFQSSFVDASAAGQARQNDFYRTITHEIGHALGIFANFGSAIDNFFTNAGTDQINNTSNLDQFNNPNGQFGVTATLTASGGGHLYEGAPDPAFPNAPTHQNDLMNPGRTVPVGNNPAETTRQFISDLDVMILADAYGYAVTLPSTFDSAHVMLDDLTGMLLVQGSARNATTGAGVTDTITIERVTDALGDDIRVTVDPTGPDIFTERVPYAKVTQIVVNGNDIAFTNDPINKNANVEQPLTRVAYVVSTNEDVLEDANSVGGANANNAIIDLSQVVPGTQVSLRAAIRESNALNGDRPVYVGRGIYELTLLGTGGDTQGDLDITSDMTIIGAGAGVTVIDAGAIPDRVLEVNTSGVDFSLFGVTLTGGTANVGAGDELQGGAIFAGAGTSVVLTETALIGNLSASHGGGLRKKGSGSVEIYGSILEGNTSGANGGGIYSDNGTITLGNSIIANNMATVFENDIFGIPSGFDSYGNNLLTSVRANLINGTNGVFDEVGDDVNNPANLFVVTTVADGVDANDGGVTLREAFVSANAVNGSVWLPPWRHRLTRMDNPNTNADNDLAGDVDLTVTGNVEIVGVGAGLTVIDASGLGERIFDVRSGSLDISRVTLTGGDTTSGANGANGGAIWVRTGAALNLSESAVIGNTAGGSGGGIFSEGTLDIVDSVIANNSASSSGGLHVTVSSTATIQGSILANNSAATGQQDVFQSGGSLSSTGNNLRTSGDANVFNQAGDHLGTVDYVVTSVIDTFTHADDSYALSVREAVDLANNDGTASEAWLPAWDFVLTRTRAWYEATHQTVSDDISAEYGDIDIHATLTLRGISDSLTTVNWRSGTVEDEVFKLLGDFNGDFETNQDFVGQDDYYIWSQHNNLGNGTDFEEYRADANEDGYVNQADFDIWISHLYNQLYHSGITFQI